MRLYTVNPLIINPSGGVDITDPSNIELKRGQKLTNLFDKQLVWNNAGDTILDCLQLTCWRKWKITRPLTYEVTETILM